MGANPFEELGAAVESLRMEVRNLSTRVEELRNGLSLAPVLARIAALAARLDEPAVKAPEWEALNDAAADRRKGRRHLLRAINDGVVAARRVVGRGGRGKWLLSVADLDKHFPVLGERPKKEKPSPQRLGFSESDDSCPAAPSYRTNEVLAAVHR